MVWWAFVGLFLPTLTVGVAQKNVYGEALALCSTDPVTGWYRDGYCNTDSRDGGAHVVCAGTLAYV